MSVPRETIVVAEFPFQPRSDVAYSLAGARKDTITHATHTAHKYPAKFIPQIPSWAIKNLMPRGRGTVLDPFCGSGTTLVEAGRNGHKAIGADISPLAALMTRAKCAVLPVDVTKRWGGVLPEVLADARKAAKKLTVELADSKGLDIHGLHYTWSNWFDPDRAAGLLELRRAIERRVLEPAMRDVALTALSSILKSCSYLNEDQIKVRYQAEKKLADPFVAFDKASVDFFEKQSVISEEYKRVGAEFEVILTTASRIPLEDGVVNLVATSPPYINAVDYTMAHKYNMFVLGLLETNDFKTHCRDYIGVTERAVRAEDMANMPQAFVPHVKPWIDQLLQIDTPTARNRAYVVTQYFNGMYESLVEARRLLQQGGSYYMVVGETNRICGQYIPTADLIEACAIQAGFGVRSKFLHALANRSAMRLSRSKTGGEIPYEQVFVFEK